MDDFTVVGKIVVDSSGAMSIQGLNRELGNTTQQGKGLGAMFGGLGNIASFAIGGLVTNAVMGAEQAVVGFAKSILDAAQEEQKNMAQLNAVLTSTKGVSGMTATSATELADSLRKVTTFSDDTILSAENMLLTFTNIGKDVFPNATSAVLDMSTALGEDTRSAAMQLGKALNDPIQGVTALRRVGVQLTDEQEKQVKAFMAVGDVASAQKIILGELTTEFGGSAQAAAGTYAGRMEQLKNQFEILKEQIGGPILGVLSSLTSAFMNFVNMPQVQAFIQNAIKGFSDLMLGVQGFIARVPRIGVGWGLNTLFGGANVSAMGSQLAPLGSAFKNLFGAVQTSMPKIKETLGDMFGTLKTAVASAMPTVLGNLTNVINQITAIWRNHGDEIMAVIKYAWMIIVNVISGAIQLISGILSAAFQIISGLFDVFSNLLHGNWKGAWDSIVATVMQVGRILWNTIKAVLNQFAKLFGTSLDGLVATWTDIFHRLPLILSIEWQKVLSMLGDLWKKVKATVAGWGNDMATWAKGIIDGLILGVKNNWDRFIKSFEDLVKKALKAVLKLLGIESPSKVFMEVGANVTAGFAKGITDTASGPINAISNVAQGVVSAGSGVTGGGVGGGIVINVNGAGDPAAVAREVWQILNNKLKVNGAQPLTLG